MECGHVAQHFGLPNSDSIRHHGFDSGRMMKTSITRTSVARRVREGGGRRESLSERQCAEELSMQGVLPEGGVIRKLWIGETEKYRDHMLRLDPASRRSRFGGGVSDDFIRSYVDLTISLEAVVHGFFIDGEMRGAAELRQLGVSL